MKTKQEIFDIAATGVIEQGHQSIGTSGACAYRGRNGAKCAVGHLISDQDYDPAFDRGVTISCVIANRMYHWEDIGGHEGSTALNKVLIDSGVADEHDESLDFLQCLQRAHDSCSGSYDVFISAFIRRMTRVANDYNLNTDALKR